MNYYEILKVSPKATDSEIKSSYKKLVKKYHPDLYQGDKNFAEQKIKEINEAYDILSNSKARKEYDDFLNPQPAPGPTYTKTTPSSYYKTTQQSPRPPRHWSFIEKKISKLDKNKQSQVIVLIFIFALLLFLISLIQTHNYLKNHQNKLTQTPEQPGYNPYYEYDHKTMDELFYEMIIQSEKEYYNTISANITNP